MAVYVANGDWSWSCSCSCSWKRHLDMFHVDVASAYVAMRRIPYKIINECHSKCFAAILAESPASTGERPRPHPHRRHSYRLSALSAYLASILSESDGCLNALFEQQCLSFPPSPSLSCSLLVRDPRQVCGKNNFEAHCGTQRMTENEIVKLFACVSYGYCHT